MHHSILFFVDLLFPSHVYTTKLLLKTAVRVITGSDWSFRTVLDEDVRDGTDEAKGSAELLKRRRKRVSIEKSCKYTKHKDLPEEGRFARKSCGHQDPTCRGYPRFRAPTRRNGHEHGFYVSRYHRCSYLLLRQSSCAPGYPTSRKGICSAKTRWGVEGSHSLFDQHRVSVCQVVVRMVTVTQRRTLRVNFLSGRQGKVLVCDGELCGGGGEAGGDGSNARCCWPGCAEERWGEHDVYKYTMEMG